MRETLLVVENDPINAELFRLRLERWGYGVIEVQDSLTVENLLQSITPHLILMDLSLGPLDGWTLTGRIKSNPRTAGIPVIAVTAHAMPEDRAKALSAGCDEYVSKPVDFLHLRHLIAQQLVLERPGST